MDGSRTAGLTSRRFALALPFSISEGAKFALSCFTPFNFFDNGHTLICHNVLLYKDKYLMFLEIIFGSFSV